MEPSTALAVAVVDELVRGGVREAVLSPGSRNAPLAYALYEADRLGRLRLHVRIDERTAGFLALGLAKASGKPVVVTTTSGTAAVNLHPAIVEADYAGVCLLALTADRPGEMRGTGANQTINQTELYGGSARLFLELSLDTAPTEAEQRSAARTALQAAVGRVATAPAPDVGRASTAPVANPRRVAPRRGPVQVNIGLREPLVPRDITAVRVALSTREPAKDSGAAHPTAEAVAHCDHHSGDAHGISASPGPRTVVVAGDGAGPGARACAEAGGWPLLAEPSSGARGGPNAMGAYRLYLDDYAEDIERVVVFGRPTLSRPVARLLDGGLAELLRGDFSPTPQPDLAGSPADTWLPEWRNRDAVALDAVHEVLAARPLSGPAVAAHLVQHLPAGALLVAGSSSAIRDLDLVPPRSEASGGEPASAAGPVHVLANRGASGIDGTVSTAVGAALAAQDRRRNGGAGVTPAYAFMGDLTFLHDANGLVLGPQEPRPDLTIVVVNDNGGGLFSLLEQGEPDRAEPFERVFGTPHQVDLAALCASTGTPYALVTEREELRAALEPASGIRVVEVPVDRTRNRDLHARLHAAVAAALSRRNR